MDTVLYDLLKSVRERMFQQSDGRIFSEWTLAEVELLDTYVNPPKVNENVRKLMSQYFSLGELQTLAFDLGLNYDGFDKTQLTYHILRSLEWDKLRLMLERLRKHVNWNV